jgi:hypothetical protein
MIMSEMSKTLTGCGSCCTQCPSYTGEKEPKCQGCNESKGNPFWGKYKTYQCISNHGVDHCALCEEFPCDELASDFIPNNPAGQKNAVIRIGVCAYRARHSDIKTVELLQKIGKPSRVT